MGNSSFAALVLVVLLIVVAVLLLSPRDPQSMAALGNPAPQWSRQR